MLFRLGVPALARAFGRVARPPAGLTGVMLNRSLFLHNSRCMLMPEYMRLEPAELTPAQLELLLSVTTNILGCLSTP
jgi:hypothetical protein